MRKALLCEIRVAITLWQLRTNDSYRTVGHLFSVSCSSVCLIVKEGCQSKRLALCNVIETSRPRVPIHEPQRRLPRKGTWCSCFNEFGGISKGTGRESSSWLKKEHLWDKRAACNPSWSCIPNIALINENFGDHGGLTTQQKTFNYSLSRARIVVENSFGRLKGRWRCLLKRNDTIIKDMPTVISACCVLYNICEVHSNHFNREWLHNMAAEPTQPSAISMPIPTANISYKTSIVWLC